MVSSKKRIATTRPKKKREIRSSLSNIYGTIKESHFNRYISHGLYQSSKNNFYSESEIKALEDAKVEDRLPPRATDYYMNLASRSTAIRNLIKARPEETKDLSGESDPSNQLKYSPVPGLLHKYELVLLYVVRACSSWCRYCYRSDFLVGRTEKDIGSIQDITSYIKEHNKNAAVHNKNSALDIKDRIIPIREALLSGGDPMVLSNKNLFDYMHNLAEAGIRMIRIGTKELAFFPQRFDDNFFEMIDLFHELHPRVGLAFMVHFTHPDELLELDDNGKYIEDSLGNFKRIEITENAIKKLRSRYYITLENQTPIIDNVNDNSDAINLLQKQLKRIGINNHYFFQCREIEGHKAFAVTVEKSWKIHSDSQMGLSGIEKSRFAMSTEAGKLEVVSVIDRPDFKKLGIELPDVVKDFVHQLLGDGLIIFKMHRTPYLDMQSDLVIAKRNPEALWITGYEDRIIYDGRKKGDEKYSPLAKLLKPFIENIESDLPEILNKVSCNDF